MKDAARRLIRNCFDLVDGELYYQGVSCDLDFLVAKVLHAGAEQKAKEILSVVCFREHLCACQLEAGQEYGEDSYQWRKLEHQLEGVNECLKLLGLHPSREEYRGTVKLCQTSEAKE